METITLQQVLPAVFAESAPHSDVWLGGITFRRGEKYLVESDSGGGKSSLFAYLYGYRDDYSGTILFDGCDVRGFAFSRWDDLRRRSLALMFQDLRLFPELTARENVEIKNNITHFKTARELTAMFDRLGVGEKMNAPVSKLSFGQQQRVAFIRTLCQPADFILLDEPASHLDDRNAQIVAEMIAEEARRQRAGVIISSIGRTVAVDYDKIMAL